MSIKLECYRLIKDTLSDLKIGLTEKMFKFIGHYNNQDLNLVNNFAYDTPAAFIAFSQINWVHLKHDTPADDLTREQDGLTQIAIHYFFHDLQTDTDSFEAHLQMLDTAYRALTGLRSDSTINGKVSTLRRIKEFDIPSNNNLRHWITFYETRLQETGNIKGLTDAQPVEFIISGNIDKIIYIAAISNTLNLAYDNFNSNIKTNG